MISTVLVALCSLGFSLAQQVGTQQTETHPRLTWQKCTGSGSCQNQQGSVVIDSNWRWTHVTSGYTNCYTDNAWNTTACADAASCSKNCAIDGANYSGTYGITTSGSQLSLRFVTKGEYATNVGSRVYLMASDTKYQMFKLKNQEFTFDVDLSKLPCGLNGALYFVTMDEDGGLSKYSSNKAGAKYGTGYCDAQCPHDLKWINGEANVENWKPSESDKNSGTGKYGSCCGEMDIWEANSMATAFTPHPCTEIGQTRCSGSQCGDIPDNRYGGMCDKDGCDFSHYRLGDPTFFGKGKKVDTTQKITVVTQFITQGDSPTGDLIEIRRLYVQGGQVIQNSKVAVPGVDAYDSITDKMCADVKTAFGDTNDFQAKGGLAQQGRDMDKGMVLVMSIWDDHYAKMLWLDSSYPLDKPESQPGIKRGDCPTSSGAPAEVEAQSPDATVVFSNIRFGDIGSTYSR